MLYELVKVILLHNSKIISRK